MMKHKLSGNAETREVYLDGEFLDPRPSYKYYNHSPDGYNWGYTGSGPAQLALAIMLKLKGKPSNYQSFKSKIIAEIPQERDFDIEFDLPVEEKPTAKEPTTKEPVTNKSAVDEIMTRKPATVKLKNRLLTTIPMYYTNNRKKIMLTDGNGPVITPTVNIPGYPCEENQIYVKDYEKSDNIRENKKSSGMLAALIDAKIIYPEPVKIFDKDYPRIFLMLLTPKAMKLWEKQY